MTELVREKGKRNKLIESGSRENSKLFAGKRLKVGYERENFNSDGLITVNSASYQLIRHCEHV